MAKNLTPEQLKQFTSYLTPETLNQIYGGLADDMLPGGFRPQLGYEWDSMEAQVSGGPGRAIIAGYSGPIGPDDMYDAYDAQGKFLGRYKAENDWWKPLIPLGLAVGGQFLFGGGLGGAGAAGSGLTGADLAIAAGEGILPITAAEASTLGLTEAQLAALGSGIGLGEVGAAAAGAAGAGKTASGLLSSALKNPQLLGALVNLAGAATAGKIAGGMGGGGDGGGPGALPAQGIPTNSPEYYQAIQNYYNAYLPDSNPNVGSYLADWYSGRFTQ